jgi:peptidoglycan/xylan/chitin deacetylase (PgdA/CDA1 family)
MKRKATIQILTFHGLGNPERDLPEKEGPYWLPTSFFKAILDRVKERPNVRITFDDANSSDFKIALPELLKRKLQATFFLISGRIGQPGFLTTEQILALAHSGMVIGSHGTHHRRWTQLSAGDLYEELNSSRSKLESIVERTVQKVSCPFGNYNRKVLQSLRAAGYTQVYTSDHGPEPHLT